MLTFMTEKTSAKFEMFAFFQPPLSLFRDNSEWNGEEVIRALPSPPTHSSVEGLPTDNPSSSN